MQSTPTVTRRILDGEEYLSRSAIVAAIGTFHREIHGEDEDSCDCKVLAHQIEDHNYMSYQEHVDTYNEENL